MKGVWEFIEWYEGQNDFVQVTFIVVGFALLILWARAWSRWLGGKR